MEQKLVYTVRIDKDVQKYVAKQQAYIIEAYNAFVAQLQYNPLDISEGYMHGFKYKGMTVYKKRFGGFRLLYVVNQNETLVFVFDFDTRGDIYKSKAKKR